MSLLFWAAVGVAVAGLVALVINILVSERVRLNAVDVPNARSLHQRPTLRGGGAAIVLVMLTAWSGLWATGHIDPSAAVVVLLLMGAALATVGWADDRWSLSVRGRLAAQVAAAGIFLAIAGTVRVLELPQLPAITLGALGLPLAMLWLVGMTNAFNFMDGADGLAGSQAVVAGLWWTAAGVWLGMPELAVLGFLLAAASAGFLWHNWAPARIFLGDVGSLFLGFVTAALVILGAVRQPLLASLGLTLMWPCVFDVTSTLCRRWSRGERLAEAHRSHLYQRLVLAGYSHAQVAVLYGAVSSLVAAVAFLCLADVFGAAIGLPAALAGSAVLIVRLVQKAEARV